MSNLSEAPTDLIAAAAGVRLSAYAPYSKFFVGAAVRASDGTIYAGCNVENASYGLTVCAERNALFQMVAAGRRTAVEIALTTIGGHSPCGACRQVFSEFADDLPVWLVDVDAAGVPISAVRTSLDVLLPGRFKLPRDAHS